MCGIFFCAHWAGLRSDALYPHFKDTCDKLKEVNSRRGPDVQRTLSVKTAFEDEVSVELEYFSSELWLRGTAPIVQPHQFEDNILCWNGEIFEGLDVRAHENDGDILFQKLCRLRDSEEIVAFLGSFEGPYAFIFFHAASQQLFFGRDPLGRRSFLVHHPAQEKPYFLLASTSVGPSSVYDFEELPTEYIYRLDVSQPRNYEQIHDRFEACLTRLSRCSSTYPTLFATPSRVNETLPPSDYPQPETIASVPEHLAGAVDELIRHLERSTMLRVRDIPHVGNKIPGQAEHTARVAILFSGGIDCTLLAYFAHRNIPLDEPIDLLNVAFENPWKLQNETKRTSKPSQQPHRPLYMVPDRVTGLCEVEELRRVCLGRQWNFVEVNVPFQESTDTKQIVEALMHPSNTVMDLSLAMALYFASRGVGLVRTAKDTTPEPYTSHARVVLSGLGSDELLGGYTRHRNAFKLGWRAVVEQLQLEIDRIPTRNLGRDDRIISSHGKETRHPFLSLSVVNFLASLPVHHKLDPRLEMGTGDKLLLRLAARKLGLVQVSQRKKKAMQFGSHSARMNGEKRGDVALE